MNGEHGDDALVERTLAGDSRAFGLLVDRYGRLVYNVALRMTGDRDDAEDLAQIIFVKAYEHLGAFDRSNRFFSWLYRIVIHECLNARRSVRHHEPLDERIADPSSSPEDQAARSQEAERAQEAILRLKDIYREAIVLRHFAHLSYEEMSEALGVPAKTVKSRLHTARRELAEALAKRGLGQA